MTLTQELIENLARLIQARDMKVGDVFPSENELSKRFQVSRHTVREAIRHLVQEGHLYRIQGKGTFIASRKLLVDAHKKMVFSNIAQESGFAPGVEFFSVFSQHAEENEYVAGKLEIEKEEFWCVEFIRRLNDIPLIFTSSYLKKDQFPELDEKLKNDIDLYEILKREYDISQIEKQPYTLEVSTPERKQMLALQIPESMPLFVLKSYAKDNKGNLIDYRISVSRSDMVKFTNLEFKYDANIV